MVTSPVTSACSLGIPDVQGTGDKQCPVVGAEALASAMPRSHLQIVEDGGHFAYFGCDVENRRKALKDLISSGRRV